MATLDSMRRILPLADAPFEPYDLEGAPQPGVAWLPVTYDRETGRGSYLFRMAPGTATTPHDHPGWEEFLILDGTLIESDGKALKAGEFVSYAPGSVHSSRTETGCTMLVVEW